ncbi:uncharacterized protein UV8b_05171 [Ustilaginoidea virens]|uniref:Bacteriophage T5 Orf172 DNA-binding domain-containing protein n=1 Tax=Ustilaginoidea virens TaxID=1159556 RepID=A0A1B5L889_USTVR|nr:uncharacterized protein UV8b_05171 [Ustilaginoidea virens]QUC20930.1 hypothetical protein UV8b_05171 [Ustilaginoidea virens]GAO19891.1 hypothetical protein UVI_02008230 [Ustilaginoidea virens]
MPFVANTPESLLDRADSKNPVSTCRGITSSGRPCRRSISSSDSPARAAPPARSAPGSRLDLSDETLYCWQHREQAGHSAKSSPGPRPSAKPVPEERRCSLDTLADRLGIVDLQGKRHGKRHRGRAQNEPASLSRPKTPNPKPLRFCLCFSIPSEEEVHEPPRRPRPTKPRPQPQPIQKMPNLQSRPGLPPRHTGPSSRHRQITSPSASSPGKASRRSAKSALSLTARLKDLVPDSLDAPTASALMAELARPHAESEEAGYIYMFWLTPSAAKSPPPVDAARSLLAPPDPDACRRRRRRRRPSDAVPGLADARGSSAGSAGSRTMLLKIGRAANVQRRMNQWRRQCGYDIEVLRYYPHVAAGSDDDDGARGKAAAPRMTPHCKKVERLIHVELTGMGLRADMAACEACGREHREWFAVQATREGIRAVDHVIRRWVEWDEEGVD